MTKLTELPEVATGVIAVLTATVLEEYAPASVNGAVGTLRTALRLCWKRGQLARVPYLPLLTLKNLARGSSSMTSSSPS